MWAEIRTHWKTNVQSLLTGVIGLSAVAPQISFLKPKHAAGLVSAGVVSKVLLALFQKDAGTELAQTPQGMQAVDSHETPNDPNAKVVK